MVCCSVACGWAAVTKLNRPDIQSSHCGHQELHGLNVHALNGGLCNRATNNGSNAAGWQHGEVMGHGRYPKHSQVALHNAVPLHQHLHHRLKGTSQESTILYVVSSIIPSDERMLKQRRRDTLSMCKPMIALGDVHTAIEHRQELLLTC